VVDEGQQVSERSGPNAMPVVVVPKPPPMTVAQAKANLLVHGEIASREIDAFISRTKADVEQTVGSLKKAVPWAAAAALGAGLFMGKRRSGGGGGGGKRAASGGTASTVKWAATTLAPIALRMIRSARHAAAARKTRSEQPVPE
jgi:hypothetical protein